MEPNRQRAMRPAALLFLIGLLVNLVSCRPELVVTLDTRVYADGSLDRRLKVSGRTDEGEIPEAEDWLEEKVGLALTDPAAWGRVEQGPGWLRAEGFFDSVDGLPALLGHRTPNGTRPERLRTTLEIDDGVVLHRWSYAQHHGDLYSRAEIDEAVAALVDLVAEALSSEVRRQFGDRVDSAPAVDMLRNEVTPLAAALVHAGRRSHGTAGDDGRTRQWSQILSQYGYPTIQSSEVDGYWDAQIPVLLDGLRQKVAAVLSDERQTVQPAELTFWPVGDEPWERLEAIAERSWGTTDALQEEVESRLAVLSGYYGGGDGPRFRFEVRAELPGTLLRTNGTPDGNSAIWLLREDDLSFGEQVLRVESVRLDDEALRRLAARREFDPAELVRLADLLWARDRDDALVGLLNRALLSGGLDRLRDPDELPDELAEVAEELAELLTPG